MIGILPNKKDASKKPKNQNNLVFEGFSAISAPSTESQKEIWMSAKLSEEASLAYNMVFSLRFKGEFKVDFILQAIQLQVARHQSLRSTFSFDGSEFYVHESLKFDTPVIDLSSNADKETQLKMLLVTEVNTPFDLERGPLFRCKIIKISKDDYVLITNVHHIVADALSCVFLIHELAQIYNAQLTKKPAVFEEVMPFVSYARLMKKKQHESRYKTDEKYWLNQYKTTPPLLNLPADRPRGAIKTFRSGYVSYHLGKIPLSKINSKCLELNSSLPQILLAAFEILLYRLTGNEDLIVGMLTKNQAPNPEVSTIGHGLNTLAIRQKITGDMNVEAFLQISKKIALGAYKHRQYTYGSLIKQLVLHREVSQLPMCSVLFNMRQSLNTEQFNFTNLTVEGGLIPRQYEHFELCFTAEVESHGIHLEVQYNSDLFDEARIKHYLSCYETIVDSMITSPQQSIAQLPLLSLADREKILYQWNQTQKKKNICDTVQELLTQQTQKTPNQIAVQFETYNTLTYQELDKRSNQLARCLQAQGVKKGSLVGIYLERSLNMIVSTIAVLKAGAAYVPLDPAYPEDRISYMIDDSKLELIISQNSLIKSLPKNHAYLLSIEDEAERIATQSDYPLEHTTKPEDPAYVIYTSGSTGAPKGVLIAHRAVVNLLTSFAEKLKINDEDIMLAVTTLSFDIAVIELYLPLTVGARTVIAKRETAVNSESLLQLLIQSKATMMQATPSTWRLLILSGWDNTSSLDKSFKVMSGGEAMSEDLASQLLQRVDGFWNVYGPTETTVWSTLSWINNSKKLTIGRPIDNTELYVLDSSLNPVPIGVVGELYIGGMGLALGYIYKPELTAQRFMPNPYTQSFEHPLSTKMYQTGDLVRYRMDGSVEYIGRNDTQVKVRGYRIELSEIEAVLGKHQAVHQNVVITREDSPGDVRIVAYAVMRPDLSLDFNAVCEHLRTFLPDYMIPQHFMILDYFPLTPNGKVDRKVLPSPIDTNSIEQSAYKEPRNQQELIIAAIWSSLLKKDKVSIDDNFFNLGGHSLLAMQFITQLYDQTGFRVNPRLVLLSSLESIAKQIPLSKTVTKTEHQGLIQKIHALIKVTAHRVCDYFNIAEPPEMVLAKKLSSNYKKPSNESLHFDKPSYRHLIKQNLTIKKDVSHLEEDKSFMKPLFFESNGKKIFGIYHPPQAKTAQDSAILLCYPIGYEYIRSHWTFNQLTTLLVKAGFTVFRFDYYATGDSTGLGHEGDVLQWKMDINAAASQLRLMSGKSKISLIGRRFGATLAAVTAKEGLAVERLILWDPIFDGEDYINEIKTLHLSLLSKLPKRTKKGIDLNTMDEMMGFIYPLKLQRQIQDIKLIRPNMFTTPNMLVITGIEKKSLVQQLTQMGVSLQSHYVEDALDKDIFAEVNSILLSPLVVQLIVKTLTEEA